MDGDEIFSRVLELYQSCSSYSDAGAVSSDAESSEFKTYFCRPAMFRFEWFGTFCGQTRRGLIFSNSNSQATYFDGENIREVSDLALAVAAATGVSSGVAPLVAHLLMPDLFAPGRFESLESLRPYMVIGEDHSCHKLSTNGNSGSSTTLFIDKMKPIIRRIELCVKPSAEERARSIEALESLKAPELEEVRALSFVEDEPHQSVMSYNEVTLDVPISADFFKRV